MSNDNIQKLESFLDLKRSRGKALGIYYEGVAATGRITEDAPSFILIAADNAALETVWDRLMAPTVLNFAGVHPVTMFHKAMTKEDVTSDAQLRTKRETT